MENFNWSLVQAFLAVAETGSLSGAARQLKASQPTLGRQIREIETQLGAELFHRQPRGLALTQTGAAMVGPARAMRDAMNEIAMTAAGHESRLEGVVRITASVAFSVYHLPAVIADIRAAEPQIDIELVPSDDSRNLHYREADIAIRMYRPTQLDLVTRHIGEVGLAAFAAKSYLKKRGHPKNPADLQHHDLIGYDANQAIVEGFKEAGFDADNSWFQTRCDDQIVYWELVRAGCGIGFAQENVGRIDPLVEQIDLGFPIDPLPVWLTAHAAMRQTPRIGRVWDLLVDGLAPLVS